MTATQEERRRRRISIIPRTRKGRVASVVALLVAVPAIAWAVYYLLLGISGTFTSNTLTVQWHEGDGIPAIAAGADLTCSGTTTAAALTMNATGYPGDSCTFVDYAHVTADSAEPGVLVGVNVPQTFSDAGWTIEPVTGDGTGIVCGDTVTQGTPVGDTGPSVSAEASKVYLQVTAGADSTTLDGLTAGLDVVPQSQYDANPGAFCTP